jgi:hypothetical protein
MQHLMQSHRRGQKKSENVDDVPLSDPAPNPETSARYQFAPIIHKPPIK